MNLKSLTADKLIGAAARFFSTVLNPLLAPAYGVFLVLWTSVLCYLPSGTRMAVLTVIFGTTCILPMILIGVLHNFKIVKNKRLDDPKERFYPYLFTILCYIGAASYLNPRATVVCDVSCGLCTDLLGFHHSQPEMENQCPHGRNGRPCGTALSNPHSGSGRVQHFPPALCHNPLVGLCGHIAPCAPPALVLASACRLHQRLPVRNPGNQVLWVTMRTSYSTANITTRQQPTK